MSSLRRRWRTVALGVAVLAFVLAGARYWRAAALEERGHEAARRGAAWLLALDIPLKDPAIAWIVSAIDRQYCVPPRATDWVRHRVEEFEGRRDPIYTALRALSLGKRDEHLEEFTPLWNRFVAKGDVVSAMAYGAFCDRVPRPEVVSQVVRSETSAGYTLTHQFLALLFMKQNGCLSAEEEKILAASARAIASEQHEDPVFSDLSAERVAMLLYAGERRLVDDDWIEALLAAQQPSGAWSDPTFPRRFYKTPENPHTTALAVWALSEYGGGCPF